MEMVVEGQDGFEQEVLRMLRQNAGRGVVLLIASPQGLIHFSNMPDAGEQMGMLHRAYIATEETFRQLLRAQSAAQTQIHQDALKNTGGKVN